MTSCANPDHTASGYAEYEADKPELDQYVFEGDPWFHPKAPQGTGHGPSAMVTRGRPRLYCSIECASHVSDHFVADVMPGGSTVYVRRPSRAMNVLSVARNAAGVAQIRERTTYITGPSHFKNLNRQNVAAMWRVVRFDASDHMAYEIVLHDDGFISAVPLHYDDESVGPAWKDDEIHALVDEWYGPFNVPNDADIDDLRGRDAKIAGLTAKLTEREADDH
ncbi:MAG TPA: hypothetical protein VGK16_10140 [Candidatus Limnocylindrales bacterium]